ncbi:MAG: TIGR01777 family oxidoreductase [Myxococcales bacterium]|nr:TIGR01777 family oxidoreductase [Myxococcales bacterium]
MTTSETGGALSFEATSFVPHPQAQVFAWHERPGAFSRLTPPWETVEVLARQGTIRDGDVALLKVQAGPLRLVWEARHFGFEPGVEFKDEQVRGPFSRWVQTHRFTPAPGGTTIQDLVDYQVPGGALGRAFGRGSVEAKLLRLFSYRHEALAADLTRHAAYTGPPLRILVAGGSGLVGRALCAFLSTGGHDVYRLVRPDSQVPADAVGTGVAWQPREGILDVRALPPLDAVINLAGENVAGGRWTDARKKRFRTSRVDLTRFLAESLAAMNPRPKVFLNASAMGIYGPRGDEPLTEESAVGTGYLAELCQDWEAATEPARRAGIRVAMPRIGLVLAPREGVLGKLLPAVRAGVGGRLGSGKQWMSWVALDDLVGALHHALVDESLEGPFNVAAPGAETNAVFTETLGHILKRPTFLPVPAAALKLAFGEMGEMAMSSVLMRPERLTRAGFSFRFDKLEDALAHLLGTNPLPRLTRTATGAAATYLARSATG